VGVGPVVGATGGTVVGDVVGTVVGVGVGSPVVGAFVGLLSLGAEGVHPFTPRDAATTSPTTTNTEAATRIRRASGDDGP
jgi:hypothetical protein